MLTPTTKHRTIWAIETLRRYAEAPAQNLNAAIAAVRWFAIETSCLHNSLENQLVDVVADLMHLSAVTKAFGKAEPIIPRGLKKPMSSFIHHLRKLAEREKLDWDSIVETATAHFKAETESNAQ